MTLSADGNTAIRLELVKNQLLAITDEMSAALQRSAYSTNIKTRADFSCALFDVDARLVAQSASQPTHLGSLVKIVPRALSEFGADRLAPGDAIITNDPHRGATHLNDVTMISSIRWRGHLVGYVANIAHHVDIGGSSPGSLGLTREIWQEGLIIPPIRIVGDGVFDDDVLRLVAANVRLPDLTRGDLRAQLAANRVAQRRLESILSKYGTQYLAENMAALLDYTEQRVRTELAALPHGTYEAVDFLDSDGFSDEPVTIAVKATIDHEGVVFDLSKSDDQGAGPMNATQSMSFAGVAFVLKALIDDDIPINDGFYRSVMMSTRPGSVVDCRPPAAVGGGWEVCFRVAETAFKALAPAFEDRIVAATKGIICNVAIGGRSPSGDLYAFYETVAGGQGGSVHQDGMDGVQTHIHNTENAPVEEVELTFPVRILRYCLIPDSGGAGKYRGGLGVRRDYYFPDHDASISVVADRARFAPWPLGAGKPGRLAHYILDPDTPRQHELPSKVTVRVEPGQVLSVQTPGGGGCGDPRHRDEQAVLRDVREGKVSASAAKDVYGVDVDDAPGAKAVELGAGR
jgi:N-methylhydantoinase B